MEHHIGHAYKQLDLLDNVEWNDTLEIAIYESPSFLQENV